MDLAAGSRLSKTGFLYHFNIRFIAFIALLILHSDAFGIFAAGAGKDKCFKFGILQSESGDLKTRKMILNRLAGSSDINCIINVSQAKKEAPGVTSGIPLFTCNMSVY